MARPDPNVHSHLINIAPAPGQTSSTMQNDERSLAGTTMPFNCQLCVRRKVKCDRTVPACATCIRGKVECIYQAPPPRALKRKRVKDEDIHERLKRYEQTLQENGLLPAAGTTAPTPYKASPQDSTKAESLVTTVSGPDTPSTGRLLSGGSKTRYIDSSLWFHAEEANMPEMAEDLEDEESDDNNNNQRDPMGLASSIEDPISGALLGISHDLSGHHPSHKDAMKLWNVFLHNVDPICKVIHPPTTRRIVEKISQQPGTASKPQECLLFTLYYFAVFSMTDEDCLHDFGQTRTALTAKYLYATRQAFVNASWLKTNEITVLQAYVIYLIAMRTQSDPHVYWIWTGVAIRLGQRMGLHRDGEALGLPPFDVEMRRRLFWNLLPLDGYASQMSGTGISLPPNSWDTKIPLNVNDDQIYPGMVQPPEEQKGATDMIFFLTKSELSNFYNRTGVILKDIGGSAHLKDGAELERLVDEVESLVESKYLRYCDIVNPVHFMTFGMTRAAANTVRLHSRIRTLRNKPVDDRARKDLCLLAQKIIDTDTAVCSNPNLKRFQWQERAFFMWYSLICILTSLAKVGLFSASEVDGLWLKIADVYTNHPEILETEGRIYIAVGRVTLEAWTANPPSDSDARPEPFFIATLRARRMSKVNKRASSSKKAGGNVMSSEGGGGGGGGGVAGNETGGGYSFDALLSDLDGGGVLDFDDDFNLSDADWVFWDQLCHGANRG